MTRTDAELLTRGTARAEPTTHDDDAPERADPNNCPECARSYGPHYVGPCEH